QAVEAKGDAAVGRRAVLEGIKQEAKLRLRLLGREAEQREHARLHRPVVDADGAATHFYPVDNQVVGIGTSLADGVGVVEQVQVVGLGR
nr:hypothetical protein [Tanacetum cinerariifolium]